MRATPAPTAGSSRWSAQARACAATAAARARAAVEAGGPGALRVRRRTLPRGSLKLSHVTIGTNDIERAKAFYGPLMGVLGAAQFMEGERSVAYGRSMDEPMIVVTTPFDGAPATVGNGTMVGLRCADEAQADAVYEKAMSLGAKSEGEVGLRGDQNQFYGGYFRDPDGNKLAAFTMATPKG